MGELIKYNNCQFEKNELRIDENITKEEWIEIGTGLSKIQGSVQVWIGDWARFGEKKGFYTDSKTYQEIAEITGYDPKTIKDFKYVADNVPSSVRTDDMSFQHMKELAPLKGEEQVKMSKRIKDEGLSAKEVKQIKRLNKKIFEIKELPKGVFNVVYCDPPWEYDFAETDNRKIENHYPTMTMDELKEMELPELDKDCLLLMWATVAKLPQALELVNSWGFVYKTHSIWDKQKIGMGYWFRGQHELLIVATRGKFSPPEPQNRTSSIYVETRTEHSSKPEYYYEWIEKCFPQTNKIELFSRNKREGWEAWGNE